MLTALTKGGGGSKIMENMILESFQMRRVMQVLRAIVNPPAPERVEVKSTLIKSAIYTMIPIRAIF